MEKTGFGANINVEVIREGSGSVPRTPPPPIVKSVWETTVTDQHGRVKSQSVQENLVTDEGLAALLEAMFLGGTQITDWYVTLISSGTSPVTADTYAAHGYTECTDVTNVNRPTYNGVRSGTALSNNASKAVFTMDMTGDLLGGALVGGGAGASTLGDTSTSGAVLYCAINFNELKSVVPSDIVSIAITLTAYSD